MSRNILYIVGTIRSRMKMFGAFLLIVANLWISSVEGRAKMKKYLWLQDMKPCTTEPDQAQVNGSFTYTRQGSFYVDVDVYTPSKIDHLYLFADLKKCPTKLLSDDCEDMMSFPVGDQCYIENAYFRSLYNQFVPPLSCPILGHYQAKKVILDSEMYSSFFRGLAEEEWLHVYLSFYSDEKMLTKKNICLVLITTMKKIRVEDKSNRKRKE